MNIKKILSIYRYESNNKNYNSYYDKEFLYDKLKNIIYNKKDFYGKFVLIKPNLVKHYQKSNDEFCLTTNLNFVLNTLEVILEEKPSRVMIADAPIQGCKWDNLIDKNFINRVQELSSKYSIEVIIKDFRRTISDFNELKIENDLKPLDDYIIFDVGNKSFLEPITEKKNKFRVTNYNPDRLSLSHSKGVHKYCIAKDVFDADIILSLPKLKTHQKAGITCSLKNLVGLNGDKDFLPHHRIGGIGFGGDCYPGRNYLRRIAEFFLDKANRKIGKNWKYDFWLTLFKITWRLSGKSNYHQIAAGWYGNDTTWRMVLDINLIARYGTVEGKISANPQREIYSLCDGLVIGEGNGPLQPEPVIFGVIAYSQNSSLLDEAMAILMGFDASKIPLIVNSTTLYDSDTYINYNDVDLESINELENFSKRIKPAPGWVGFIEK